MSVNIIFLGHAGFVLQAGEYSVAIDPFLTGNPLAVHTPDQVRCKNIVVTHGHADHLGDTVAIAKANGAMCYGAFELCGYLDEQDCRTSPGNPGGTIATDFGYVAFTQAFHSSSYEGRYMGMPCGVIVHFADVGFTFHHTGDTALFGDLKLIGEIYRPDVSAICAGDRFTMGPQLATKAAELIKPGTAIPIHYRTWPLLVDDVSAFKPDGVAVKVMEPGESWQT